MSEICAASYHKAFAQVPHYWDRSLSDVCVAKLLPGQFYVSREHKILTTLLGSCVAVCIYDDVNEVAGMNHFMLPKRDKGRAPCIQKSLQQSGRYGSDALPLLIDAMCQHGGRREHFNVGLYGGGRIIANLADIGRLNIDFAETYLSEQGLSVTHRDVGGRYPRKIKFWVGDGHILVTRLKSLDSESAAEANVAHRSLKP